MCGVSLLSHLFAVIEKGDPSRFSATEIVTRMARPERQQQDSSNDVPACREQRCALLPARAPVLEMKATPVDDPSHHIVNTVATASLEWIAARDQYINHLMHCRDCHAPIGRYCAAGAKLRQRYNALTEEQAP